MFRRLSRLLLFSLLALLLTVAIAPATAAPLPSLPPDRPTPTPLFIDLDAGVDDGLALALLLRAPTVQVVGITTVAGNATVENVTRNVLTMLDVAGKSVPVTIGADRPRVVPLSHMGWFVHGPDGLWGAQQPHDLSQIPHDAPAAIAAAARANPGMTLLTLGPLTNIAAAVERYPQEMAGLNIVSLFGGLRGNSSPVAEANAYNDPHSLEVVLGARLRLTMLTLDAWDAVQLDPAALTEAMSNSSDPLMRFLVGPISTYAYVSTQGAGGTVSIPDAVAAVYVLAPRIATPQSGLVKVSTEPRLTRGQTVIGLTPSQKITMIADDAELSALVDRSFSDPTFNVQAAMGAILAREPDNAQVILSLRKGATLLMPRLLAAPSDARILDQMANAKP